MTSEYFLICEFFFKFEKYVTLKKSYQKRDKINSISCQGVIWLYLG